MSTSMVGRVPKALKERGVLREPPVNAVSARKRMRQRPYAVRKPKGYRVAGPGDLVEVDTLDLRPLPGVILKHFTARDLSSRWDVLGVYTRATTSFSPIPESRPCQSIQSYVVRVISGFRDVIAQKS